MALCNQFKVEIALVNPEGTQQPVVLIAAMRLKSDGVTLDLPLQGQQGYPAMGLAEFRGVNSQETNPLLAAVCRHCRDGVAIMDLLNRPGFSCRWTGLIWKAVAKQAYHYEHDNQPDQSQQPLPRKLRSGLVH